MHIKSHEIDYSLLDGMKLPTLRKQILWIILIALAAPLTFLAFVPNHEWLGVFLSFYFIDFIAITIGLIVWWFITKARDEEIYKNFLVANGFEYQPKIIHYGSGSLYSVGHSKRGRLGAAGYLDGWPINFFQYIYTVGSGKNQSTYDSTVMWVGLPRVLPHMVIDSVVEESNDGLSTLPIRFDKAQKIELEGDFAKYFDLYAPDSYGVSLLTILAPDAMEAVMKHAAFCDIEIIDNNLYFYWPDVDNSRKGIESKFKTVQTVLAEIGDKLTKADIYARPEQATVHAAAAKGVRLEEKTSWYVWLFIGIFGLLFIGIFVAPDYTGPLFGIVQGGIPIGLIGLTIMRAARRNRLRDDLLRRYHK